MSIDNVVALEVIAAKKRADFMILRSRLNNPDTCSNYSRCYSAGNRLMSQTCVPKGCTTYKILLNIPIYKE